VPNMAAAMPQVEVVLSESQIPSLCVVFLYRSCFFLFRKDEDALPIRKGPFLPFSSDKLAPPFFFPTFLPSRPRLALSTRLLSAGVLSPLGSLIPQCFFFFTFTLYPSHPSVTPLLLPCRKLRVTTLRSHLLPIFLVLTLLCGLDCFSLPTPPFFTLPSRSNQGFFTQS